jgi:hypothetical protein
VIVQLEEEKVGQLIEVSSNPADLTFSFIFQIFYDFIPPLVPGHTLSSES